MGSKRFSPLLEVNRRLGARIVDFAGWDMPLQFTGVVAEHNAVRTAAGVFDVSHLGKLRVSGPFAGSALQTALTADVEALEVGRAGYSLVLNDAGRCIDDVFVYRLAADEWLVVPNAANVIAVGDAIRECGAEPLDEWARWAIMAVQGPRSFELFDRVFPGVAAGELKLHRFRAMDVYGQPGIVARTGYTGERGVELYAPAASAPQAYERLIEEGATPVGLGARDTLRLEMGYALYGHELSAEIDPFEAGLQWTLAWDTPFRGRDALREVARRGPRRSLFGIRCTDKGVPRRGYVVRAGGVEVGEVTSGNFSPTLGTGIALALGTEVPGVGSPVEIEARGRTIAGLIVDPPFVKR